jgi:hypothetical protein
MQLLDQRRIIRVRLPKVVLVLATYSKSNGRIPV